MKNLKKVTRNQMKNIAGGAGPLLFKNCSPMCCPTDGRRKCPGMICPDVVCPQYI